MSHSPMKRTPGTRRNVRISCCPRLPGPIIARFTWLEAGTLDLAAPLPWAKAVAANVAAAPPKKSLRFMVSLRPSYLVCSHHSAGTILSASATAQCGDALASPPPKQRWCLGLMAETFDQPRGPSRTLPSRAHRCQSPEEQSLSSATFPALA